MRYTTIARKRTRVKGALVVTTVSLLLLAVTGVAQASTAAMPVWQVSAGFAPTNLPPSGEGQIVVVATNLGDAEANGASPNAPVSVVDKLPAGLEAITISGGVGPQGFRGLLAGVSVECIKASLSCSYAGGLPPYEIFEMTITVKVVGPVSADNETMVVGGGARGASAAQPVRIDGEPTQFGLEGYELTPLNPDGSLDTQAGSHPFELTTTLSVNKAQSEGYPAAAGLTQNLRFQLPAGLVGNATAVAQCTAAEFDEGGVTGVNGCPASTAIGVVTPTAIIPENPLGKGPITMSVPLFNLAPSEGEPARFGFDVLGVRATMDTSVRTGEDYGVTVRVNNITQAGGFMRVQATFWGVPGDPSHDSSRGWSCLYIFSGESCALQAQKHPVPFLTLPTSCMGPLQTTVEGESWPAPGKPVMRENRSDALTEGLTGCNRLPFSPEVRVAPDGQAASTPTGLTVDEHVPQEPTLNPEGLAEADVKGLSLTLPEGLTLNPAAAGGLEACSLVEVGLESAEASLCPDGSKVATVKIDTPLLPDPLEGAAYLATQDENPFGSLVAMYIVAEDPEAGVLVKATGEVIENPETGQLTAHFEGDPEFEHDPRFADDTSAQFLPQTPFEDIEVHFFGGNRAPMSTPPLCGSYTTMGSFTPWSESPTTTSTSTFRITTGVNGGPCRDPLPFAPSLTAGTASNQAGGFSPFTMTMSREDGNQNLKAIQLHMPPGLLGVLSGVKLCEEPQADAGTCGQESLIGHTTVSVGLGGDPFTVTGGQVFLTGPYEGAPFGLSIVNPATAGPFHLGDVIVRAKIEVDPQTAQLRISSNSSGPYAIPPMLMGIPLQIKHVNVTIDRSGFTFNPTNCDKLQITGIFASIEGSSAAVSTPFQVTNCATLAFKPKFAASTAARSSKADGTSLTVKLTYPKTPQGSEANIAKVKVDLPKQLPSRLTTLQKACLAKVFEANPANCPSASIVGHAKAITPILPVPLEGPAYFVSHGGEAFPSLIMVLQGYGVTIDLVGTTNISKAGITSSTFKAAPDVSVDSFELTLPEGKYSALAANLPAKARGDFCGTKLAMPTAFVGQNGAEIHESTPITVSGCPKAKQAKKGKTKHGKKRAKTNTKK
jgi:hypothetical protein